MVKMGFSIKILEYFKYLNVNVLVISILITIAS